MILEGKSPSWLEECQQATVIVTRELKEHIPNHKCGAETVSCKRSEAVNSAVGFLNASMDLIARDCLTSPLFTAEPLNLFSSIKEACLHAKLMTNMVPLVQTAALSV